MTAPHIKVMVVGISGVTCSGKSTLAKELHKIVPNSKVFCQDDYFLDVEDPRHVWLPELNHINFDILSSLDMERMTKEVLEHVDQKATLIKIPKEFNNQIVCFRNEKFENIYQINRSQCHLVIIEGFCIFNYKPLADLCDLKYYFTLDYEECFKRRVKRIYEPPDCPGYFEKCAWPEHLKQISEVRQSIKDIVYFNGNSSNQIEDILRDIVAFLRQH